MNNIYIYFYPDKDADNEFLWTALTFRKDNPLGEGMWDAFTPLNQTSVSLKINVGSPRQCYYLRPNVVAIDSPTVGNHGGYHCSWKREVMCQGSCDTGI